MQKEGRPYTPQLEPILDGSGFHSVIGKEPMCRSGTEGKTNESNLLIKNMLANTEAQQMPTSCALEG